jgi:diaminopimelate decarboxylase
MLVGNAGVLLTRIIYVKEGATRTFVIVDAAMNDLLRPALYGANHAIVPVVEPAAGIELAEKDVVGPICETGDTFATRRPLPPVAAGELLVLRTAGAYGAVMASTYNGRPLVPEVLVNDDVFAVVSERPSEDDLLARQRMPAWLEAEEHDDSRSAAGGRS